MVLVVYNEERIITRMINCSDDKVQETADLFNLKTYKTYKNTNAYGGLSIDYLLENGNIKTDKQLLKENLISLAKDEVLDGDQIRTLTLQEQVEKGILVLEDNEEIRHNTVVTLSDDEMRDKYPERYHEPSTLEMDISAEEEALYNKQNELFLLKDQYINADIDENEKLKGSLKTKIQKLRKEISELQK